MAETAVKLGFEMEGRVIALDGLLPMRQISAAARRSVKYKTILASIREVGIIEPPVVHPSPGKGGFLNQYLLLDGHLRVDALRQLGATETFCLISTDDEAFTYNQRVNRMSVIQEHHMIMRALEGGVSEERLARALSMDVASIRRKRTLLDDICPEAIDLLKDKSLAPCSLSLLKKVQPMRQIEIAELMCGMKNFSTTYVKALIVATPAEAIVAGEVKCKSDNGLKPEDIARMEKEMAALERDYKLIEESYGTNNLHLVLVRGYVAKLLDNARVVRFLSANYADILGEFQKIVEAASLDS